MNFNDLLLLIAQANGDRDRIDPNEYTFNFYKIDSNGKLSGYKTLSVTITDFTYKGSAILFPEMQYVTIKGMTSCSFKYLKSVGYYSLYQFAKNSYSTISGGVEFPALATIGDYGLYYAFQGCTKITSASFRKLKAVDADYSMQYSFNGCTSLTKVNFTSLATVSGNYSMQLAFSNCKSLTEVNFPKLTEVGGSYSMEQMFAQCSGLTEVNFPMLTSVTSSNSMHKMFNKCSSSLKVHFKESMSGNSYLTYSNLGLSSSLQIVFDLP